MDDGVTIRELPCANIWPDAASKPSTSRTLAAGEVTCSLSEVDMANWKTSNTYNTNGLFCFRDALAGSNDLVRATRKSSHSNNGATAAGLDAGRDGQAERSINRAAAIGCNCPASDRLAVKSIT